MSENPLLQLSLTRVRRDGTESPVQASVGPLYQLAPTEWVCELEVIGIRPSHPSIHGIAAIQALSLAIGMLHFHLQQVLASGGRLIDDNAKQLDREQLAALFGVNLRDSALSPASALVRLARWYLRQCDTEWEHQYGVNVDTLDNPGWTLAIDLVGTRLEMTPFEKIAVNYEDCSSWIVAERDTKQFRVACGPLALDQALTLFLDWAEEAD